jgi:hypothetical protein
MPLLLLYLKSLLDRKKSPPPVSSGDEIKTEGDYSPGKVGGDYVTGDKVGGDQIVHHHEAPKPEALKKILTAPPQRENPGFIGREEELKELDTRVKTHNQNWIHG